MAAYIPESGDIVWMHFTPHAGHEQAGKARRKGSISADELAQVRSKAVALIRG